MQIRSDVAGGSGGQYISVEEGIDSPDAPTDGIATYTFTVAGGTYEIDCRVIVYSGSDDAYFVTIPGAAVNRAVHDSGWVYWNGVEVGEDWHWDIVHSRTDDDLEVEWTLEAGTHTLQIAYRNGGPLLDARKMVRSVVIFDLLLKRKLHIKCGSKMNPPAVPGGK